MGTLVSSYNYWLGLLRDHEFKLRTFDSKVISKPAIMDFSRMLLGVIQAAYD